MYTNELLLPALTVASVSLLQILPFHGTEPNPFFTSTPVPLCSQPALAQICQPVVFASTDGTVSTTTAKTTGLHICARAGCEQRGTWIEVNPVLELLLLFLLSRGGRAGHPAAPFHSSDVMQHLALFVCSSILVQLLTQFGCLP